MSKKYNLEFNEELDIKGIKCPIHILKVKKKLSNIKSGEILKVYSDDYNSIEDFKKFSKNTGNNILEFKKMKGHFIFIIKRK